MNGEVGAVRDHVAKVVVVDYFMKLGIKTTMVVLVLVLVNITKGLVEKHFFSFFF